VRLTWRLESTGAAVGRDRLGDLVCGSRDITSQVFGAVDARPAAAVVCAAAAHACVSKQAEARAVSSMAAALQKGQ